MSNWCILLVVSVIFYILSIFFVTIVFYFSTFVLSILTRIINNKGWFKSGYTIGDFVRNSRGNKSYKLYRATKYIPVINIISTFLISAGYWIVIIVASLYILSILVVIYIIKFFEKTKDVVSLFRNLTNFPREVYNKIKNYIFNIRIG